MAHLSLLFPERSTPFTQFLWPDVNVLPSCDYHYTDTNADLSIELPGFEKSDIQVSVSGRKLTVSASKDSNVKESKGVRVYTERYHGTCKRTFKLPFSASNENVRAKYENGILSISIEVEKREPEEPKTVTIE